MARRLIAELFVGKESGRELARKASENMEEKKEEEEKEEEEEGTEWSAGPLFFYFGLSTSPEKIASLKRIRLGFHNGSVRSRTHSYDSRIP